MIGEYRVSRILDGNRLVLSLLALSLTGALALPGADQLDTGLVLRFLDRAAGFLAGPEPDADKLAAAACLVAEAELVLEQGAVAVTLSNGSEFATYLVEEFGGSVPFWSTADSRRAILTTEPHRYRIEIFADTGRVYVDGHLYSDINSPLRLTSMSRAGALFNAEETALLRKGGLLIKAVAPNHRLLNRPPYAATTVKVTSARTACLDRTR